MNSEYLVFEEVVFVGRKTKTWSVRSKRSDALLGTIKWYGAWRQYTFWPQPQTIWNVGCLADVQKFITMQMEARRG